jgi:hypothetical protein
MISLDVKLLFGIFKSLSNDFQIEEGVNILEDMDNKK